MIKTVQLNPWLTELLEAGLEPAEVLAIIRSFQETAPAILAEAEQHLDRGDAKEGARAAHRLVGGAANVGLVKLEMVVRDLERCCEEGEPRRAMGLLGAVGNVFETAQKELEVACALLKGA